MSESPSERVMNDMIALWHDGAGDGQELHEYLGMTWEEYAAWVEAPGRGVDQPERPLDLLREWFEWWQAHGPAKLPDSLHVRTAMAIALNDFRDHKEGG